MARRDDLRLMAKIANLYHQHGQKQTAICKQLGVHQSTISRLLKRAEQEGIVRVSLNYPAGFYPELEGGLESRFGLGQAIVVDAASLERQLLSHLGSATAVYLANTLNATDIIGISSWSSSLLAMVEAMEPVRNSGSTVVQILGGVGNPAAEVHATHLTQRLAQLIGGRPVLLTAPGVVRSVEARDILKSEPFIRETTDLFDHLTVALVGIGALEPSQLLATSGNIFQAEETEILRKAGAVGDICLHFFDAEGRPIGTPLDQQVIGISLEQIRKVPRVVAVAGGLRKAAAIGGALKAGLLDVLITDQSAAQAILEDRT